MLNFIAAMRLISYNSNTRVRRKSWRTKHLFYELGSIWIHDTHMDWRDRYVPDMESILASDWEIVRDEVR